MAEKRLVYYLLKYLCPRLVEIARYKQTTGLGHVTVADMKRLHVCWPSPQVLEAFDVRVGPIFDKAFANTLESQTLATLRDTLLPKLLSGEMSVTNTLISL
jgi:type I restriction enzyme S subunit